MSQHAVETELRQDHEQSAAQCHEEMCSETRLLGTVFPLQTDGSAQHGCNEKPQYKLVGYRIHMMFTPFFVKM